MSTKIPQKSNHPVFKVPGFLSVVDQAIVAFENSIPEALSHAHTKSSANHGVYALYYNGNCDYPQYQEDKNRNQNIWQQPIYIGRANKLSERLKQHLQSIMAVEDKKGNLKVSHFVCRFLKFEQGPTEDLTYPTEQALIRKHHPLWNKSVTGFGAKVVGKERTTQNMAAWDVMHPGRLGRAEGGDPISRKASLLKKMDKRPALLAPP